jgi:putative peptidoglycan lipid II flippase
MRHGYTLGNMKGRFSLLGSTLRISILTLGSRILGFVRDVVLAHAFGAGPVMDAFLVAFKIPNFFRRLFAEGAFAQAFVPVLSEAKVKEGREGAVVVIGEAGSALALVLLALTALAVVGAPWVVVLFAPGFAHDATQRALAAGLLQITFPYLLLISLTALAGSALNTFGRFAVAAAAPMILNVTLIAGALLAERLSGIRTLAWCVPLAGTLQLLWHVPFLYRLGLLPRPRLHVHRGPIQRIVTIMVPALFGASVAQLNLLVDTIVASLLVAGSISWLYYADRLMEFPLGIFGIAIGTVILPSLATEHAAAEQRRFADLVRWGMELSLLVGLPAAIGLMTLANPIMHTMFASQRFSPHDVAMAAAALQTYAFGLPGFFLVKVLVPAFYARQKTREPVTIGVVAVLCNTFLSLAVVLPLAYHGVHAPHALLALGTSISAYIQAGALYWWLRRGGVHPFADGQGVGLARVALGCGALGAAMATEAALRHGSHLGADSIPGLVLWILVGAACYGGVLLLSGLRLHHLQGPLPQQDGL